MGGCLDPLLYGPFPLFNGLQRLLKVPVVYNEGVKKIILMYISPTVSAAQRQFYVTYKSYISGSDNKVVDNTDPESCASSCLSEASFICRSFEFDNSTSTCHMSTESTVTSALASSSNSRFFELSKYEVPDKIFYITKSVLALLLVNLRSITYCTDQIFKPKWSLCSSKSFYLEKLMSKKVKICLQTPRTGMLNSLFQWNLT